VRAECGARVGASNNETRSASPSRPCVAFNSMHVRECSPKASACAWDPGASAWGRRSPTGHVSPVARVRWPRALVGGVCRTGCGQCTTRDNGHATRRTRTNTFPDIDTPALGVPDGALGASGPVHIDLPYAGSVTDEARHGKLGRRRWWWWW
jgi:hypothetical protein